MVPLNFFPTAKFDLKREYGLFSFQTGIEEDFPAGADRFVPVVPIAFLDSVPGMGTPGVIIDFLR